MNVTTEDIRNIKPGAVKPFLCEDAKALYSACSLVSILKNKGMPEGVVNYETQKFFDENIILIRAMKEGDSPVLNK
jgi:hypothetical protein